jgi:hypothetical protein
MSPPSAVFRKKILASPPDFSVEIGPRPVLDRRRRRRTVRVPCRPLRQHAETSARTPLTWPPRRTAQALPPVAHAPSVHAAPTTNPESLSCLTGTSRRPSSFAVARFHTQHELQEHLTNSPRRRRRQYSPQICTLDAFQCSTCIEASDANSSQNLRGF